MLSDMKTVPVAPDGSFGETKKKRDENRNGRRIKNQIQKCAI
jgi:hypothetical protein